jgi:propanol-preferring alcohol dehydrogenase
VLAYEVSVQTTFCGDLSELADVVDLAARGIIGPRGSCTTPLSETLTAYRGLPAGKAVGRAVIRP